MQTNPTFSIAGVWDPLPGAVPPGYDPLANTFDALIPLGADGQYGLVISGWSYPSDPGPTPQTVPIVILGPQADGGLTDDTSEYISDPTTNGSGSVIVADFNGDGIPDIVLVAHNEDPFVAEPGTAYMSTPSGGYEKVTLPGLTMAHDAELTTINGQLAITTATFTPGDYNPIFTYTDGQWVETLSPSLHRDGFGQSESVGQYGANGGYELVRGDDMFTYSSPGVPLDSTIAVYGFNPDTDALLRATPIQKITPYLSTLPQYADYVSMFGAGLTHTYRLWTDDLNHDGLPDILAGESMFNGSSSDYPSALQVLINTGDGKFQDETATLNPSMSLDTDELDYNPQFVDLDNSGINSYLFGKITDQGASRQSNYLILNDGTGHLYVALHDQFQALDAAVKNYVAANYTAADGYSLDPNAFSKYMGVPQPDGSVDYVAEVSVAHAEGNGVFTDQYVFVNVPLQYNPTTDFTQDCDITDRNGSTLIRTWAGNDTFYDTDAGPTTHIDGGLGTNTSIYSGVVTDYQFYADAAGSVHVASLAGAAVPAVDDTLVNVQTLQFKNASLAVSDGGDGDYTLSTTATDTVTGTIVVANSTISGGVETASSIGAGTLVFDGGTLQAGAADLVFANAVKVSAAGGTFDTDGMSLTWQGAISADSRSSSGGLTVADSSDGQTGVLILEGKGTYAGGVTIEGGTLELDAATTGVNGAISSGAAGTGAITFAGTGAETLQVDAAAMSGTDFAYSIDNFAAGSEVIDLSSVTAVQAVYSNGVLTLEDGTGAVTATLHISGDYTGEVFNLSSDGQNGVDVSVGAATSSQADVLIQKSDGELAIAPVDGSGVLSETTIGKLPAGATVEGSGNLLGDGQGALLIETATGQVKVAALNATDHLAFSPIAALGSAWSLHGVGDLIADGQDQFVIENGAGEIKLGEIEGGGAAVLTAIGRIDPSAAIVGVGDFIGDGAADLLVEKASGALQIGEISGDGKLDFINVGSLEPGWTIEGVADVLGDGQSQILMENASGRLRLGEIGANGREIYTDIGHLPQGWRIAGVGDYSGDGSDGVLIEDRHGNVEEGTVSDGAISFTDVGQVALSAHILPDGFLLGV